LIQADGLLRESFDGRRSIAVNAHERIIRVRAGESFIENRFPLFAESFDAFAVFLNVFGYRGLLFSPILEVVRKPAIPSGCITFTGKKAISAKLLFNIKAFVRP